MARQEITTTPTAIANLTVDTRYSWQNKSSSVIHLETAASAPTSPSAAFAIAPGTFGTLRKSGDEIYLWTSDDHFVAGGLVYDEAS